jgi:hypothetical protein
MSTVDVQLSFSRARNIVGGVIGSLPYQNATSATLFIPIGANSTVLQSNGTTATWATLGSLTAGAASQVNTIQRTTNASHYLTFVDSDNATATAESIYTTSTLVVNPNTSNVGIGITSPTSTLHVAGTARITGITTVTNTTNASSTITGALQVVGGVGIGQDVWVGGGLFATTKSFVINHPTKLGMKLRYGSLEGPENGVYVRGKLNGSNTIELPDHWTNLVDSNSITVNLTPIGNHQNLYVKDVVDNTIIIGNGNLLNKEINCFYTIFAERKDVGKLEVEF